MEVFMAVVKKLFKHGGSYAVDIPIEFVNNIDTKEVILVVVSNEIHIHPKKELDTIESEPQFAQFISALAADALKHPEKLRASNEVWDEEWKTLLKGIQVEGGE